MACLRITALLLCTVRCKPVTNVQNIALLHKTILFEQGFEGEVIAVVDGDTLLRKDLSTNPSLGTTGQRLQIPNQATKLTLSHHSINLEIGLDSIKKPVIRAQWSSRGWWVFQSDFIPVYE